MKTSDLFFTPNDLWRSLKGLKFKHVVGLVVAIIVGLGVAKLAGKEAGFFAGMLFFLIIARAAAAVPFTLAIITFVLIIIATPLQEPVDPGDTSITKRLAVWAFYLLVIGVILLVIDNIWPVEKPAPVGPLFIHPVFGTLVRTKRGKIKRPKAGKIKHRSFRLTRYEAMNSNYLDRMHKEHLKEVALEARQTADTEKAKDLAKQLKLSAPARQELEGSPAQPFRKVRPLGMDIMPAKPIKLKPRKPSAPQNPSVSGRDKKNLIRW